MKDYRVVVKCYPIYGRERTVIEEFTQSGSGLPVAISRSVKEFRKKHKIRDQKGRRFSVEVEKL